MPEDTIHCRINPAFKSELIEFVEKSGKYKTLTDFIITALVNQLAHDRGTDDRTLLMDQLLDAIRNDPKYRAEIGAEFRALMDESQTP